MYYLIIFGLNNIYKAPVSFIMKNTFYLQFYLLIWINYYQIVGKIKFFINLRRRQKENQTIFVWQELNQDRTLVRPTF